MFDVFISHSTDEDGKIANEICDFLESDHILKCWIAPRQITGGKTYPEEIMDGIIDCPVFLLVLSQYSVKSKHILNELDTAFNENKELIPYHIDNVEIPKAIKYYLQSTQHIFADTSSTENLKLDDLKQAIIDKIPELASEREKKQISEYFANKWGWTVDRFEKLDATLLLKRKSGDLPLINKPLNESNNNSDSDRSRYDILQDSKGNVLIVLQQRKGEVCEQGAVFIIDSISRFALLYRSHESTVLFDDIAQEANKAFLSVSSISIVECSDNDIVREYKAAVRVVQDVRYLLDDDFERNDETDLYEFMNIINGKDDVRTIPEHIIIEYESHSKEQVSSDSLLIYQNSGDNVLFLTNSFFVVPERLTNKQVEILDNNGTAYVNKIEIASSNNKEDASSSLLNNWLEQEKSKKNKKAIKVKSLKVNSILEYLSDKTKG